MLARPPVAHDANAGDTVIVVMIVHRQWRRRLHDITGAGILHCAAESRARSRGAVSCPLFLSHVRYLTRHWYEGRPVLILAAESFILLLHVGISSWTHTRKQWFMFDEAA